jgi:hypothetical protein
MHHYITITLLSVLLACSACGRQPPAAAAATQQPSPKITFDLAPLDDEGLAGPPDGKVAISYEFCIPATQAAQDEVRMIDPTVSFFPGTPGRIRCTKDQILCIGSTHQQNFRTVLQRLSGLDYVARIDRSLAE